VSPDLGPGRAKKLCHSGCRMKRDQRVPRPGHERATEAMSQWKPYEKPPVVDQREPRPWARQGHRPYDKPWARPAQRSVPQ